MNKKPAVIPKRDGHDPRWAELNKYLRYMADATGLSTWYFNLSHDDPDDKFSTISIYIAKQSVEATIYVSNEFWRKDRPYQRWSITHELLHVKHAPSANAIEAITKATAPATFDILNQLDERFIDEIGLMLAPRYKLPPKGFMPTKKPKHHTKKVTPHVPHNVSRKRGEADL